MSQILINNIGQLLCINGTNSPKTKKNLNELHILKNGAILIKNRKILALGKKNSISKLIRGGKKIFEIDARQNVVMPGFIDCHTHLVFEGSRVNEFLEKSKGVSYQTILKKGGGILTTVKNVREATQKELILNSLFHLEEMAKFGITTAEIKTGYGLDYRNEVKMLSVIQKLNKLQPLKLISTFLGAHVVPPEWKGQNEDYLNYLSREILPRIKKYTRFCDIFCEKDAFNAKQSLSYLNSAKKQGFILKIHADQLHSNSGAELASEVEAISADHLEYISKNGIAKMAKKKTIAVLLPGVSHFLNNHKYAPAREIIAAGIPIALATDFNPGTCPCKNPFMIMHLACLKMGLTPEECLNAITINGAHALNWANQIGSIEPGKLANLIILKTRDYREIVYYIGSNLTKTVLISNREKTEIINN